MEFELKGYDARSPVLYYRADGEFEWRISAQNAKIFFADRQKWIFTKAEDLNKLPPGVYRTMLRDFDSTTAEELWESCRRNILFNAPGNPHHEHTPAAPPEYHRSTTRTRKNGLRVNTEIARAAIGTPQMVHISRWLADQHPDAVLTDGDIEASLNRMMRINRMNTRQDPFLVFRYYRRLMITQKILEEA